MYFVDIISPFFITFYKLHRSLTSTHTNVPNYVIRSLFFRSTLSAGAGSSRSALSRDTLAHTRDQGNHGRTWRLWFSQERASWFTMQVIAYDIYVIGERSRVHASSFIINTRSYVLISLFTKSVINLRRRDAHTLGFVDHSFVENGKKIRVLRNV